MKNTDVQMHVRGRSLFIDDIPNPENLLHVVLFTSPVAKGRIKRLDVNAARKAKNVAAVFTHLDVPGKNQIGHIVEDQPFLAEEELEYIGQPIALVVADTRRAALAACELIELEVEPGEPLFDPREAYRRGLIYGKKRILVSGDTERAFQECKYVIKGSTASGPQEHYYFETHRALALPVEDDTLKVIASSQSPGAYHHHISEILNIPQHKIELEIRRMGGAFGGKESTAVWVVAPAFAARLLDRPVKLVLDRNDDIATSGKRHAYVFDYRIGLDAEGHILAYEVDFYQQAGGCADISLPVLGRSFLHATSAYHIPNVKITAVSCKTNIPPNNAFRGFGVPQAAFSMEIALFRAAEETGLDLEEIKFINLLRDGDTLPYGAQLEKADGVRCWETLDQRVDIKKRIKECESFNQSHQDRKRAVAVQPVCFGISFTQTTLNQAGCLVNIYLDGSVAVSTGAVEMGQGVNSKIALIAADALGIPNHRVRVEATNTTRVPNASPTSASTGADLNGMATQYACRELVERLKAFTITRFKHNNPQDISIRDGEVILMTARTGYTWEELIRDAYTARVDLSCHAFYATPGVYLDPVKEKGRPYAYYAYGASLTEVEVDCLRGTYEILGIDVVHDAGKSLSPEIDCGQIEGGVIQGIGWATIEQIRYGADGRMLTAVNSYKIPDIKFVPERFNIHLLEAASNPYAVCNSKAVGEPPYIHGLGSYFAILKALRSVRRDKPFPSLPLTPEKVFMYLHG